jgi:hypothetical protein
VERLIIYYQNPETPQNEDRQKKNTENHNEAMCVMTYSLEEGAVDPATRDFEIIHARSSSSSASVLAASRT